MEGAGSTRQREQNQPDRGSRINQTEGAGSTRWREQDQPDRGSRINQTGGAGSTRQREQDQPDGGSRINQTEGATQKAFLFNTRKNDVCPLPSSALNKFSQHATIFTSNIFPFPQTLRVLVGCSALEGSLKSVRLMKVELAQIFYTAQGYISTRLLHLLPALYVFIAGFYRIN